jgi:hypothetical protein
MPSKHGGSGLSTLRYEIGSPSVQVQAPSLICEFGPEKHSLRSCGRRARRASTQVRPPLRCNRSPYLSFHGCDRLEDATVLRNFCNTLSGGHAESFAGVTRGRCIRSCLTWRTNSGFAQILSTGAYNDTSCASGVNLLQVRAMLRSEC